MANNTSIPIIVQGNSFSLAIPLQIYYINGDQMVLQDYTPDPTDEVSVQLKGSRRNYTYTPTIDGNVANIDLTGNELADNYGVVVSVVKANGQRLRSFRTDQFFIVESSDDLTVDDIIEGLEENVIYLNAQPFIAGADGRGIEGIQKTGTSGLVDTYTITYTDATTSTFNVTNGANGQAGAQGVGITSIEKTGTSGLVDTYTITLSNGQTSTFEVTNGKDGVDLGLATIVDNLVDGGSTNVLSAEQGVALKELIGETSITGAGTTIVETTMYCTLLAGHTYRLHIKYPTVDYTGISYNTSGYTRFSASVVKKDTTTEQIVYLGFDAKTALAPYYDFSVSDDAECVGINIQMRAASGFVEHFKLEDITIVSVLEYGVDELNTKVSAFENAFTVVETPYTKSMMYGTDMYISDAGVWKKSMNGTSAAAYLPVTKGWTVRMTANSWEQAYCYFVDSIGSVNDPCTAEKHLASAGTTIEVLVEEDCLLWVAANLTPDYFPADLTIIKYVLGEGDGEAAIERYAVNLCNADIMKNGTLDSNGELASGSGLVSDFMPTKVGNELHRYQKTQFVLACSSVFPSSTFAFGAVKVCLYDATKTYIGAISDVSTYIDKESDGNADLFSAAYYMRVQFAAGTSDHYVALSNKPVLPQYTPYNKENFIASKNVIYDKYHNSDGAISNMLETSLDYINNCLALGLGYGDSATAYDLLVEPVTTDPWSPNAYEGEKKQINCSTFVQLCLGGVRYKNSRYVSGSSGFNYGNGYVFDENTETNYHNPREEQRLIPCSTHNKLYANMLLKYAYMRGFAYLIEEGFKNVEVGDVIFQCSSDTNTFKGSLHVLFVSAVSLNQDGTKTISVMEDVGSGEAIEHNNLTSKSSSWVYAARFPLPNVTSKATNIVSSLEKHNFTQLSSGSTFVIGNLSLTKNIKPKGVYTAVIRCSDVGDFEIMVGTMSGNNFSPLSTNGEGLFRRGDGVTVKHFHLPVNSSINTNTLAVAIKAYSNLSSNVEVVDAKVYDGYVTE